MDVPGSASEHVRASYGARAAEYAAAFGRIETLAEADLSLVARWAKGVEGAVLDVGCGPGQWTRYLRSLGVAAEGIDPVIEFVELAKAAYPSGSFAVGRAEDTGAADQSVGGVLAWYSLIHLEPERLSDALREFHRITAPGGRIAVGFFEGDHLAPFDHAITTAWFWPMRLLVGEIQNAGFAVTHTEARTEPGSRRHGAITAQRR